MEWLEEKYMWWVLGVDGVTPRHMIREKLQREKMKARGERHGSVI